MSDDNKTRMIDWAKFVVGTILFGALLAVHVWLKELDPWLFGLPALLWGVDLSSLVRKGK